MTEKATNAVKFLRAVSLGTALYSLLFWLYVTVRIITGVSPKDLFIDWIPYFTFYGLGCILFVVSFVAFVVYMMVR